ncbi:carboxypeptidase-like regulatory domain-containing protein [Rubinisphaera sp. JC750]|uniref:carboxypeptidase-like regulatory domain-containing protein n=1 Tax=Rubinisphaera sp. JC750 TaxID=2898658 RepID=UPI001F3DE591|nr:carboxypeptidase-like regulatory domain-containing protein [Rubinisphaera sp. JC750]
MSNRTSNLLLYVLPGVMLVLLAVVVGSLSLSEAPEAPPIPQDEPTLQFAPGKGTLAGRVLLPDGEVFQGRAHVTVRVTRKTGNSSYSGGFDLACRQGEFRGEAESGIAFVTAYVDNYAAATVGPFENLAGGVIEDLEIVLSPGKPLNVAVVDPQGNPVADASLEGGAIVQGSAWTRLNAIGQEDGRYRFEHVNDSDFMIKVSAPGYEPQRVSLENPFEEPVVIELVKAQPTTGTVGDAAGNPLADVVLYELRPGLKPVLGRTNEQGQFESNELTQGDRYHGFLETPDGQRMRFDDLESGQTGLTFAFPPPRQLTVTVRGNLEQLQLADKKLIRINQHVAYTEGDSTDLRTQYDNVAYIIENETATLTFPGLIRSRIAFRVDGLPVSHEYDGVGDVHIYVDLDTATFEVNEDDE